MCASISIRARLFGPLLLFVMACQISLAQNELDGEKKRSRRAVILVQNEKFKSALTIFKQLYKSNPQDPKYNYYMGFIYLNIATDKSVAIPYLEIAYQHQDDWPRVTRYLGRAHHLAYQFDEAIRYYEEYLPRLKTDESRNSIKQKIQKCRNGKLLVRDTIDVVISNLGNLVNSPYPDYAPIISSDDQLLIFTSRRPTTTGGKRDFDQLFFEDIYMSLKKKDKWEAAVNVGEKVNTPLHDASVALSADAQKMFIYHGENIYITTLKGETWSAPKKVGSNINTKSWETHACISLDQQVLYFTSDREGGYGGMDIYMALKLPNGRWGLVQNLGPTINTENDEKAPFIHPADRTLYFSSQGHFNMGGLDIFKSSYIDNKWTTPKNLGHPINTPGDDIFYVVSANGKHTYFSSDLRGDNIGAQDIYQLVLPDPGIVKIAVIKGRIYGKEQKPLSASFMVLDQQTKKVVGVYNSNSLTGKYLLVFPTGRSYDMVIQVEGFVPHRESFTIPNQEYAYNMFQEVGITLLSKDDSTIGQKIIFRNSFFDIEKAIKADVSIAEYDEGTAFSQFLRNLEDPKKREVVLANLAQYDETETSSLYNSVFKYQPLNQIHLFPGLAASGLEPTLIEFERDTIVLNNDTIFRKEIIYATSSSSATIVQLATLDTAINIVLEAFEKEIKTPEVLVKEPEHPMKPEPLIEVRLPVKDKRMKEGSQNVLFGFDKASIQMGSASKLDEYIALLNINESLKMEVNGHTDHIGPTAYNKILSIRRAHAVAEYIKSKGIAANRLLVNGYGETQPVAANQHPDGSDNPSGREKNRRTEVRLVNSRA